MNGTMVSTNMQKHSTGVMGLSYDASLVKPSARADGIREAIFPHVQEKRVK